MKQISNKYLYLTLISIIFLFYFLCLSPFVQGGDTAELVLASKNLFVAHPPGYPLFIWLNFLWNKIFIISTDYFRASFLNVLFSISTIVFLTKAHIESRSKLLLLFVIYFFSIPILEATLLPDVFALHGFFIGWMFFTFKNIYSKNFEKLTYIGFPFFLGFTNHLTMILLTPLFISAYLVLRKNDYFHLRFIVRSAVALTLSIIVYLSILFFNTKSYYSWGNLDQFISLVKHMLRFDYGTFNFAPQSSSSYWPSNYIFFLKENYFSIIFLTFPLILSLRSKEAFKNFSPMIFSAFLAFLFLATANFSTSGFGSEIILRFHTLPILTLLFTLSIIFEFHSNFSLNKLQTFVLYFIMIFLFMRVNPYLKLKNDSLMENYYQNILTIADETQSKIILVDNDSAYFGLKYFQKQNQQDDIVIISPPLFFNDWYAEKILRKKDSFIFSNAKEVSEKRELNLENDIISKNLNYHNIFVLRDFNNTNLYNISYQKIGRVLYSKDKTPPNLIDFKHPFIGIQLTAPNNLYSKNYFLDDYAYFYVAKAMQYHQANEQRKAIQYLKSALMISPNNQSIKNNICLLNKNEKICLN